jgi:hypothetical protein
VPSFRHLVTLSPCHLVIFRRFLVLAALLFWQGGFTFYAAVVVPVGRQAIGTRQSEVTRPVTLYLNLAGAVALVPLAWDAGVGRDVSRRCRSLRWGTWVGMALTLALLLGLHQVLSDRLREGVSPADPSFHGLHRAYLWVSTVQWACSLVYAGATLGAWRAQDRASGTDREQDPGRVVSGKVE